MKKIFFILSLTFIFATVSCTTDEPTTFNADTKTEFHQKSNPTLASAHYDMVTSSRYMALQGLRAEFSDKMNYTGSISNLQSENYVLNWLRSNITATDFVDYDEAETLWYDIKAENLLVVQENLVFFELIAEEPAESKELFDLFFSEVLQVPASSCTCQGDYDANVMAVTGVYQAAVQSLSLQDLGDVDYAAEMNTLRQALCESLDAAASQFDNCTEEC